MKDWVLPAIAVALLLAGIVYVAVDSGKTEAEPASGTPGGDAMDAEDPASSLDGEPAPDNDGTSPGNGDAEDSPETETETETETATETESETATETETETATETPSETETPTDPPEDPADVDPLFDEVIWPFSTMDAQTGWTYNVVGIWDEAGDPPVGPMEWMGNGLGFWNFTMETDPVQLGSMSVAVEPKEGTAFGDGDHEGALFQLYAFKDTGDLLGVMPGPDGYSHIPGSAPSFVWDYKTYWLGSGGAPSGSGMSNLPFPLSLFKSNLNQLLDGHYEGEGAALFVPASETFGYGDLVLSGRLDGVASP